MEYWRCWKLRKKVRLTLSFFPLMSFSPNFFHDMYSKKKTKLGSLLWSRLQDSLGFHLHTHITIIISSALYLLKSAIKTEWLQKILRFFEHTKKHFYFLKVALISGSFSPSPFPQKYVPNHYISSTFKKVRNFMRLGHLYRTKVYGGFCLKVEKYQKQIIDLYNDRT